MSINISNVNYSTNYNRILNNRVNKSVNTESDTSINNVLGKAMNNIADKTSDIYGKFSLAMNNLKGEKVFDLSNVKDKLHNTLLSTDVYMYIQEESGHAMFACYFQKPNSTVPTKVQVSIENYDSNREINKETLFKSVEKAILLLDKAISIKTGLGDTIPDSFGAGINLNYKTGELDFKPFIDVFKQQLNSRLNIGFKGGHLINGAADQMDILKSIREFEEFILDYI